MEIKFTASTRRSAGNHFHTGLHHDDGRDVRWGCCVWRRGAARVVAHRAHEYYGRRRRSGGPGRANSTTPPPRWRGRRRGPRRRSPRRYAMPQLEVMPGASTPCSRAAAARPYKKSVGTTKGGLRPISRHRTAASTSWSSSTGAVFRSRRRTHSAARLCYRPRRGRRERRPRRRLRF